MRRHGREEDLLGGLVGMSRRGRLALIVSVAVAAIGFQAPAALALSQRGHVSRAPSRLASRTAV